MSSIQNSPHPPWNLTAVIQRDSEGRQDKKDFFFPSFMAIFNSQFPNGINKHLNFKNLTWHFYILSIVAMFLSLSLHKWLLMVHLEQKWVHMPLGSEMCIWSFYRCLKSIGAVTVILERGTQGTSPKIENPNMSTWGTGGKNESILLAKRPSEMGQWDNGS